MNFRGLLHSGWFWSGTLLLVVTLTVLGYTFYLRNAVDQLFREQLHATQELLAILKTIQGEDDFAKVWPKVKELQEHGKTLAIRARALPKPSAHLQYELSQRYGAKWQTLRKEFSAEQQRLEQIPGGKQFLEQLETPPEQPDWSSVSQGQTP